MSFWLGKTNRNNSPQRGLQIIMVGPSDFISKKILTFILTGFIFYDNIKSKYIMIILRITVFLLYKKRYLRKG